MYEYALVLALVIVPTILLSFHPRSHMRGKMLSILSVLIISAIPFIIWDIIAYQRGHWGFNQQFLIGINMVGLPLEEVLFFFAVPYSCIYAWLVVRDFTTFEELRNRILSNKNQ